MLNHVFKTASGWNLWIYLMHPPGKDPITSIHNEHIAFRVDQSDLTLQILAWSLWLKALHFLALRYWFVATMCLGFLRFLTFKSPQWLLFITYILKWNRLPYASHVSFPPPCLCLQSSPRTSYCLFLFHLEAGKMDETWNCGELFMSVFWRHLLQNKSD